MRDKGGFAVLKTALTMVEGGLPVLSPHSDNMRYDLATECEGRIARVQVKSRHLKNGVIRLELWSNGKGHKRYYTSAEVDFIALYCPDTDTIYWIPMNEIEGLKEIRLRVAINERNSRVIRHAHDYSINKLKRWLNGKTC